MKPQGPLRLRSVVVLASLWGTLVAGATPAEEVLLSAQSDALVTLQAETRLTLHDLVGTIALRTGKDGELQFAARALSDRSSTRTVELWSRGSTLDLRPAADSADEPLFIEITVPQQLSVDARLAAGMRLSIAGLLSDLDVGGTGGVLDARGLRGRLNIDLEGGEVTVNGLDGELLLEGREIVAKLQGLKAPVAVTLSDSRLEISDVASISDLDLDSTPLVAAQLQGALTLVARDAPVEIRGTASGGEFLLDSAPAVLHGVHGPVTLETDSDLQFHDMQSYFKLRSFGGNVRGSGNAGPTVIDAQRATIVLEKLGGPLTVQGDGLRIQVDGVKGEVQIAVSSSDVKISGAESSVGVKNDFGEVSIVGAAQQVNVENRDGDVRLQGLNGPVHVVASGDLIEASWEAISSQVDQTLVNERGQIHAAFPPNAQCRVEAASSYGRVESAVGAVQVGADGRSAVGRLGGVSQPLVRLQAGGDVVVTTGAAVRAAPPAQ